MISAFSECRCKRVDNVVAEDVMNAQVSLLAEVHSSATTVFLWLREANSPGRPENSARMSRLVLSYGGLGFVVVGPFRISH